MSVTTMEEVFMKVGEDADRGLDTRSVQNIMYTHVHVFMCAYYAHALH